MCYCEVTQNEFSRDRRSESTQQWFCSIEENEAFLCELWSTSIVKPRWNMTQHSRRGSFTTAACNAFKCLRYVSTCWWPLQRHDRGEKSLREPSPSHSRQKWISWDILCQLQFALNPCEWAFPKGAIKVLLNFSVDGLSSTEIRWSDRWGCYMGGVLSQTTWLLGWFKVLFCVVTVCDKLRAEPHNISMIPTLI